MVILNIQLDNFIVFDNFSLCTSYSKKVVNSTIPDENLDGYPNFRYRKAIILMGANATGKTALGNVFMGIMNFIHRREYRGLVDFIENRQSQAFFSIDMAYPNGMLYRVDTTIAALPDDRTEYVSEDISVVVRKERIRVSDNYERCRNRMILTDPITADNYVDSLENVPGMTWYFAFSEQNDINENSHLDMNLDVLKETLCTLDPRIQDVLSVPDSKNSYIIRFPYGYELVNNGRVLQDCKLSSGTREGIAVADIIASLRYSKVDFYYCDEKFSHIHSEVEKSFISVLISLLGPNKQIFITTHNTDVLDMALPKHSYAFLRRDELSAENISCVYASDYAKKNTAVLKNMVENDVFSSTPDTSGILALGNKEE